VHLDEVVADREGAARTAEDHNVDALVGRNLLYRGDQLVGQPNREGIQRLGRIPDDRRDTAVVRALQRELVVLRNGGGA